MNNGFKKLGKQCLLALSLTSALSLTDVVAASLDSRGTDFWLTFPQNYLGNGTEFSFFLSAEVDTTVTIEIPGTAFMDTVNVTANEALKYVLPPEVEILTSDTVEARGINVTSESEFTVYGLSRQKYTTDAYLGLPTDVIGTEYAVLGWGEGGGSSQLTLVATQDNTIVDISKSDLDLCDYDEQIQLNKGDVYQHMSCGGDVSGTILTSSAPISVFGGHSCANIPTASVSYCDHIVEQLPSTSSWGSSFITVPLANRTRGDTFRILANMDNTEVSIGDASVELNRGEFHEMELEQATVIKSTQPVLVAQYSNGTAYDGVTSDPFMMIIPPYEQFLDNYTFATPTEGFRFNFSNIVVKTSQADKLRFDGAPIAEDSFVEIPNSEFSFVQLSVTPGSHTLNGTVAGVFSYGFDDDDSYGYPGGLSLSEVALVDTVKLDPGYDLVEGDACFSATVEDVLNNAIPDIRVDFLIELIAGSERTNEQGVATFCVEVTDDNPDEYTVTVSVGDTTSTGTVVQEQDTSRGSDGDGSSGDGGSGGSTTIPMLLMLSLFSILRRKLS